VISETRSTSVIDEGEAHGARDVLGEERSSADVIDDEFFKELCLSAETARATQEAWARFLQSAESVEVAADALYSAVFDSAPNLQLSFVSPRAVNAVNLMNGISQIIGALHTPKALKVLVESMGLQHLSRDVTPPRVAVFRDAILDLLNVEAGEAWTPTAEFGLKTLLNYTGGAFIFLRRHYAERIQLLSLSWEKANRQKDQDHDTTTNSRKTAGKQVAMGKPGQTKRTESPKSSERSVWSIAHPTRHAHRRRRKGEEVASSSHSRDSDDNVAIPRNFREMFRFNAAVMGFGDRGWMSEVLNAFDAIVRNIGNSYRLQEECDVLSLRLSMYGSAIDFSEFKAAMLASLRSLVPKAWDSDHEVAWSWLWANVERLLAAQLGKPARQEMALNRLYSHLAEKDMSNFHMQIYAKFFELAPTGMHFFKQSSTRLHFVADKVLRMTSEMYKRPEELVDELSASGLRHVGYGIPSELCAPFMSAFVAVLRTVEDDEAVEAFQWSLSLISRILARVINEGSTMVMRAINANSGAQVSKAVACAPRIERAEWVLNVSVGSQSISPLVWAIETGSVAAAEAILKDLLTIRADRERYYYGLDLLFERHPDIIRRLCVDGPQLLPTLLDGLIWRSRMTERGRRRVVYFLRHLLVRPDGEFADAIARIVENQDPKIACHPVISYTIDLVWAGVAARAFLYRKAWLLLTSCAFMFSQAILNSGLHDGVSDCLWIRAAILFCRCFIYMVSWPSLVMMHIRRGRADLKAKNVVRIGRLALPAHLKEFNSIVSMSLCVILLVMLCLCPVLHCLGKPSSNGEHLLFTERCDEGDRYLSVYGFFSMCGMLCYLALLVDLSVFSNRVSAFVLIVGHVLSEIGLFLLGFSFFLITTSCAAVALKVDEENFTDIPSAAKTLTQSFLDMTSADSYHNESQYMVLFMPICCFIFITKVYMVSLLIAQLSGAYIVTFEDMLGWASLKRGEVCAASMGSVARGRWSRFVASLRLDEPCEFGEGDVGMPGAVQLTEPASANVTTKDMIKRFGGSTSPSAVWPEDDTSQAESGQERLDRVEQMLKKVVKRVEVIGKLANHSGEVGSSCGTSEVSGRPSGTHND